MRKLSLSKGTFALVEDSDFHWLRTFSWFFDPSTGYAKTTIWDEDEKEAKIWKLHRLLMPTTKDGLSVDHINRNKLDNRRCNLRYVTKGENSRNTQRKDCKSGYRGVSEHSQSKGRWVARYKFQGIYYSLGCFDSPEEASEAYQNFHAWTQDKPELLRPKGLLHRCNKSGFTHVSHTKADGTWLAALKRRGKSVYLGRFQNKEDAIKRVAEYHATGK